MHLEADPYPFRINEGTQVVVPGVELFRPARVGRLPTVLATGPPRVLRTPAHDQDVDVGHGARHGGRHGANKQGRSLQDNELDVLSMEDPSQPRHESRDVETAEVVDHGDALECSRFVRQVGECRHDPPQNRRGVPFHSQPGETTPVERPGHEPSDGIAIRVAATGGKQERQLRRVSRSVPPGQVHRVIF